MSERQTSVFPAIFRGDEAARVASMFNDVWVASGRPRQQVINDIFSAGLEQLMLTDEFKDEVDRRSLAIFQEERRLQQQAATNSALSRVYENLTPDQFETFCGDNNIDADAFRVWYAQQDVREKNRSALQREWLFNYLSDGKRRSHDVVRQDATEEGIVKDDRDWANLKSIASHAGFTSREDRGYWQMRI